MKLLSALSPKNKVGDDKKSSPVHKAWENANIAQLACDEAKGWEACKDIVADGKYKLHIPDIKPSIHRYIRIFTS